MLTSILIRLFAGKKENSSDPRFRLSCGLLTGWVGIVVNFLLFLLKLGIGLAAGSIAIAADAVNNLSDAGSAIVTLIGFKLSSRPADDEHPFGHGRLEYVAGVIVAVIIVSVGLDFLKESVMRILHPETVRAEPVILLIFAGTMLFKVWLFLFYRKIGNMIRSQVISAAALDSLSDLLGTTVILCAVFCSRYTRFPVDGCAGVLAAVLVTVGGLKVLRDTVNPLLGECADSELVEQLRSKLLSCPGINGVHDIIVHNYGPNQYFATAHAEINREGDLVSAHDTLEAAEVEVAKVLPVRLLLHCDPFDTEDPHVKDWRARTENAVSAMNRNFKLYDFSVLEPVSGPRELHFHLLIPRAQGIHREEILKELTEVMRKHDPEIVLQIEFLHVYV